MSSRSVRQPLRVSQIDLDRAKRWSIGQAVTVTQDDGAIVKTHTRSAPFKDNTDTWVLLLDDISEQGGCYPVARVKER